MKKDEKNIQEEIIYETGEDATKYGEFVCSYFAWISPTEQKVTVKKLENITKDDNKFKDIN